MDECSASKSVYDVNANCQNTVGSYISSFKVLFISGDGKTCSGEIILGTVGQKQRCIILIII